MDIGKFPRDMLAELLLQTTSTDPRIIVGPGIGEDASVLDMGDTCLVVTSDPITFASDSIGWHAVQVNANDIACSGAVPKWFLPTLMVPTHTTEKQASEIFIQIVQACSEIGVAVIGGHSEVTSGITQPIVSGTMLGEVQKTDIIKTGGAVEGDSIVLTKGIAIEGTSILARDFSDVLRLRNIPEEALNAAAALLDTLSISVLKDARIACSTVKVNSLHDPTEGGLATAIREVAHASGLGAAIEEDSVPIFPECINVCTPLGINPFGLLSSGALLITLHSAEVPALLSALSLEGITGWEIGQMLAPEEGLLMITNEGELPLPEFPRDELARFIATL
jgi:hydrogenase expression/formation protein HypE